MKKVKIGIDEAGRGPWAGPLVVSGVRILDESILNEIPYLTDSKKLSPKMRESIFATLCEWEKLGKIATKTIIKAAEQIDEFGIRESNFQAMREIIESLFLSDCGHEVLIDGSDNFDFGEIGEVSWEYIFAQKRNAKISKVVPCSKDGLKKSDHCVYFVIGGDILHKVISAASILAKVTRDKIMEGYAGDFPQYGFDKNKGYGTKQHQEAILNYGINFLHRKTYRPIKALISQKD